MQTHLPAHPVNDGRHDGKPQACTIGTVTAVETLEYARQAGLIDTRPLVLDDQLDVILQAPE
ncbi:hypothetical protein D3C76_1879150 [compost metagenome]